MNMCEEKGAPGILAGTHTLYGSVWFGLGRI